MINWLNRAQKRTLNTNHQETMIPQRIQCFFGLHELIKSDPQKCHLQINGQNAGTIEMVFHHCAHCEFEFEEIVRNNRKTVTVDCRK